MGITNTIFIAFISVVLMAPRYSTTQRSVGKLICEITNSNLSFDIAKVGVTKMLDSDRSTSKMQNDVEKIALEDLGLQLTGIVESVDNGENFHRYGIVRPRIINSNIQAYDPRGKVKYYFCIIKDGRVEVYDHVSASRTFVGDTIFYDTRKKRHSYKEWIQI